MPKPTVPKPLTPNHQKLASYILPYLPITTLSPEPPAIFIHASAVIAAETEDDKIRNKENNIMSLISFAEDSYSRNEIGKAEVISERDLDELVIIFTISILWLKKIINKKTIKTNGKTVLPF